MESEIKKIGKRKKILGIKPNNNREIYVFTVQFRSGGNYIYLWIEVNRHFFSMYFLSTFIFLKYLFTFFF